ncbi:hypothetical protein ACFTQL_12570 [Peribacillus butanolivorans]|uniref:hypothetical protein n=1 Tax=Peribacillus butanolivorans TaxID=421767 RepID=UPI00363B7A1F
MGYVVIVDGYEEEYYETIEEAEGAYEKWKADCMVDGMADGHEQGNQITLYTLKPLKVSTSVIDEERMKINTPKDEGYEMDNWAKWDEKSFK